MLADDQAALLVDADGLVLAGAYFEAGGTDIGDEVSAALCGVSDEALRATRYLGIGAWRNITFEAEAANVNIAPVEGAEGALLLVAGAPTIPLGAFRRAVMRCSQVAATWWAEQ